MDARLNIFDNATAGKMLKHVTAAGKVITASTLPAATQQLVALRVSQQPAGDYRPGQFDTL